MSEETLHTAARRVVRLFNIDQNMHGGLVSVETQHAIETLTQQVERENTRQRREAEANVVDLKGDRP